MHRRLALGFLLVLLAACSGGEDPICIAGETIACTGPGGCLGAALCDSDGAPGSCICARPDGSVRDGGALDGSVPPDASLVDSSVPPDDDASLDDDAVRADAPTGDAGRDGGPVVCGAAGEDCCTTPPICRGRGVTCVGSTCEMDCGEHDEPCCGGTTCMSDATCLSTGVCGYRCGAFRQACCVGDACGDGLECMAGVCDH